MANVETLVQHRLNKLRALYQQGIDPFAVEKFQRSHMAREIREQFALLEGKECSVAGRLLSLRTHGKSTFADLYDASGRIQILFKVDILNEKYNLLKFLDIGDILGVNGKVIKTKTGEVTVEASDFSLLVKAIQPFPEKWHGLKDPELRYRLRYLDLLLNEKVRDIFFKRAKIIQEIRNFLYQRGFLEVETPMMQTIPGGASARPFVTHHNALDMDLYLRIAPELYLKRLLVGGIEKVFELGKCFRNEGISTRHNPEFTMLEVYSAYADLDDMKALTEDLIAHLAREVLGTEEIVYQGERISLSPPFRSVSLYQIMHEETGEDWENISSLEEAKNIAESLGVKTETDKTVGEVMLKVFDKIVQPKLLQPTFVEDFPVDISPLAKRRRDNPRVARRFEFFIGGEELGNSFSELNDPLEQRERFLEQVKRREEGDEEAQRMDEDFLHALEYGMPPAGGLGIGIDRLVMIFTDSPSIREVILFPQLRPASSP